MKPFIFTSGIWLGQGTIRFNDAPTKVRYYTKWVIQEAEGVSYCEQIVEREGDEEPSCNLFKFSLLSVSQFAVELESGVFGSVRGIGGIEKQRLFWSFDRPIPFDDSPGFSGREEYTAHGNDEYLLSGQYFSEEHETFVEGRIWRKI